MISGDFEIFIKEALEELPDEFKEKLDNVEVVVSDWPTREQLSTLNKRRGGGMLLGLYQGVPKTKRRNYGVGPVIPDIITIFRYPLLRISGNSQELVNNIKDTVYHEIAHHFGMSEEDIHKVKNK